MNPTQTIDVVKLANVLAQLADSPASGGALSGGFRATPSTPLTPYYTGPNGLFGVMGLSKDLISTRVQPMGLADRLPVVGSLEMNPLFGYLTGFTDDQAGAEKNGVCDDPITVGAGKSCIQTAQFGRVERQTRTFEINRVGQQINRGEFQDIRFINPPLLENGGNGLLAPNVPGNAPLIRETLMRMIEVGVSFQNVLGRMIYEGNPANNTAGGGYQEFPGLDILVGTNKVDAYTGTACPSLRSLIYNFNYQRVDTTGGTYLEAITYHMRALRWMADRMNMGDVSWVMVMRPDLFYELTSVWACVYMTYRCRTVDNVEAHVDSAAQVNFRDAMRNGRYLLVDGLQIPVILDTNIREETNTTGPAQVPSGCFASDIYILPLTVRGGMPVLYWQHLDYSQGAMVGVNDGRLAPNYFWTDGGRYLWHFKPPTAWCVQWMAKIEPRLILLTPHLAARMTNALYCPMLHVRDSHIDDPYFVDGGVTGRTASTFHSDWNP